MSLFRCNARGVRRGYREGVPFEGFLIEKAVVVVPFEKAPAPGLSHQKIVVEAVQTAICFF
jgi:hypothetical protein